MNRSHVKVLPFALLIAVLGFTAPQPAAASSSTGVAFIVPKIRAQVVPFGYAAWGDRDGLLVVTDGSTLLYLTLSQSLLTDGTEAHVVPWPAPYTSWSNAEARVGAGWQPICSRDDVNLTGGAATIMFVSPVCVVPTGASEVRVTFGHRWFLQGGLTENEQVLTQTVPVL